jgi:hypothetical protein
VCEAAANYPDRVAVHRIGQQFHVR